MSEHFPTLLERLEQLESDVARLSGLIERVGADATETAQAAMAVWSALKAALDSDGRVEDIETVHRLAWNVTAAAARYAGRATTSDDSAECSACGVDPDPKCPDCGADLLVECPECGARP